MSASTETPAPRLGFDFESWEVGDWEDRLKACVSFEFDARERTATLAVSDEIKAVAQKIAQEGVEAFFSTDHGLYFSVVDVRQMLISCAQVDPSKGRATEDDYTGGGKWPISVWHLEFASFDLIRTIAANATRLVRALDKTEELPIVGLEALLDGELTDAVIAEFAKP